MDLLNKGWPAYITEITNLEGEIKWENELPQRIDPVTSGDYPSFSLYGSNSVRKGKYKIRMTITDTLNQKYSYIIEGYDLKKPL
ncbi:MAG: hypothetical protein HC830_07875 [Bacteroidetes bacterium]|nr:hypothetical protein [Bacteroidota bacterium]